MINRYMANSSTQTDFLTIDNVSKFDGEAQKLLAERLKKTEYSDLDLAFNKNPNTGDLSKRSARNSVRQSIKNLVLTDYNERLFNPNLGTGLKSILFEPVDFITERLIEDVIRTVIENYEPRANLIEINVNANAQETGYDVKIIYSIINTDVKETFATFLETTRG